MCSGIRESRCPKLHIDLPPPVQGLFVQGLGYDDIGRSAPGRAPANTCLAVSNGTTRPKNKKRGPNGMKRETMELTNAGRVQDH